MVSSTPYKSQFFNRLDDFVEEKEEVFPQVRQLIIEQLDATVSAPDLKRQFLKYMSEFVADNKIWEPKGYFRLQAVANPTVSYLYLGSPTRLESKTFLSAYPKDFNPIPHWALLSNLSVPQATRMEAAKSQQGKLITPNQSTIEVCPYELPTEFWNSYVGKKSKVRT